MNKLDSLLDQIEAVYHTPMVGAVRLEVGLLRAQLADAQELAIRRGEIKVRLQGEVNYLRAEVERLRALLERVIYEVSRTITPELCADIDAALAGEKK